MSSLSLNSDLTEKIRHEITARRGLSFAEFMQMALYEPGLGYYSAGNVKFGRSGDFVTAPELSELYSSTLANQCAEILNHLSEGDILELGAGSGRMAIGILKALKKMNQLPKHYFIVELSAELQQRQRQQMTQEIPELMDRVVWLKEWPAEFVGIILGNEVLDAMPVHRFLVEDGIHEFYVTYSEGEFTWDCRPAENKLLEKTLKEYAINFPEPYLSEINLMLKPWMVSLSDALKKGVVLLIDYGYPRREYYHPDRRLGTLMCYYRHRAQDNPLIHIGNQDITAHVDFTAVAEAGASSGLDVLGFTHQAAFLLNNGILEGLPTICDEEQRFALIQQIKRLTLPGEMGEAFKVIGFGKAMEVDLKGFSTMNQLERL